MASGAAFTNVYVGWGVKTERFLPLPPPPVAQEYDQVPSPGVRFKNRSGFARKLWNVFEPLWCCQLIVWKAGQLRLCSIFSDI